MRSTDSVRSQGRGPDRTPSASEGHWKIEGRAIARIHERDHMQHQVQRAPGRMAVRVLSPECRLWGKSPKESRWGGEQYRTKSRDRLGKSLNHPHQLDVAGSF